LRLLRSQRANNFSWASAPVEVFLLSGPELLDGSDQVGAVRLPDSLKHPISSVLSELLVESAGEGLFLGFAAVEGGIGHDLGGTGAAQVGFGGCCQALHPLIPELLDGGGQRSRAWELPLRGGWLERGRRARRISVGRPACEEGKGHNR
jgi:hypothetical protein